MESPWIHLPVQNGVFIPLPMTVYVDAWKKARASGNDLSARANHALSKFVWRNQGHFASKAVLASFKSTMPRPPSSLGRVQVCHATMHLPLTFPSFPVHRNLWHIASISCCGWQGKLRGRYAKRNLLLPCWPPYCVITPTLYAPMRCEGLAGDEEHDVLSSLA